MAEAARRGADVADTPPEASPDSVHESSPGAVATKAPPSGALEAQGSPLVRERLRRTVSWADAQPDKSACLVAVREFEPRYGVVAAAQRVACLRCAA